MVPAPEVGVVVVEVAVEPILRRGAEITELLVAVEEEEERGVRNGITVCNERARADAIHGSAEISETAVVQNESNARRMALSGLKRRSGSQTRHFAIKSTKSSSSHLSTCERVLAPGRRRRPFELTTGRGTPVESAINDQRDVRDEAADDSPKNSFLRELRSTRYLSGSPSTSMMQASCSCSFSPGKIG